VRSDSPALNRIVERSFRDLYLLRSTIGGERYFAAGLPWYATLFGRDSLITALQTLAFDPGIAAQTLRLLARYQGSVVDDWRDEQPGKILHELRTGELARAGKVPHSPYYGTVDATPLFLILLGRYAAWTGDLGLFQELRAPVERALEWLTASGDISGRGYLEYDRRSAHGLENQGWKDAHDAIVNADGSPATPPIALVEVQGYAYLARTSIAQLYERAGDPDRAARLRAEAAALRARFNRDFWLEDRRCYALALQAGAEPAAVTSSNAGHMLWTGIADNAGAAAVAERLLEPDMFSGWGIRTLSSAEQCYDPNGYHLGTVWPHDNALIVAGLRRYGHDDAAHRIFTALLDAATGFDQYRLPELFAGFVREEHAVPVPYPVACRPQAWAAGAVPYMLASTLGLVPEAFERRLRVVRPRLPDPAYSLEVHGLRVGTATAALRFDRTGDGVSVRVLRIDGPLDVIVEGAGVRA
jgi:glycogen debranching enzyme